jgi:hypothetical protein
VIFSNDQCTEKSNVSNLFCCFPSCFTVYVLLVTIFILTYFHFSFYLLPLYVLFFVSHNCFLSRCFTALIFNYFLSLFLLLFLHCSVRDIHERITKHSMLYIWHTDSVSYPTCPQVLALTQLFISNFHTPLVPECIKVIDERWTDMTVWRLEATSVGIVLFSRDRLLMKTQLVHHSCR